jgi:hypothetical protein
VHTLPAQFGKVMSEIKLRLAVGYHFFNDFDIWCEIFDISNLSQMSPIADICYVSKILTVGSEPVISFFKKGKPISLGLPFFAFL